MTFVFICLKTCKPVVRKMLHINSSSHHLRLSITLPTEPCGNMLQTLRPIVGIRLHGLQSLDRILFTKQTGVQ